MKLYMLPTLIFVLCLFLIPNQAHSQTSFIDIPHPLKAGPERNGSFMVAGAEGHMFIISNEGVFFRSTDNGLSWELFETPFEGHEIFAAEGSHDGILVISAALSVPDGGGNTWISEDNGLTWQGLGNLGSGHYTYDPEIWIKPESITIKRTEVVFYTGIDFFTIYDFDGEWTNDLGGQYVMADGNEMMISHAYGMGACYTVCSWLFMIREDDEDIWIPVYEEFEDDVLDFRIIDVVMISDEHWILSTTLGVHVTEDAGLTWTVFDEGPFQSTYNIVQAPSGKIFLETDYPANTRRLFESADDGENWTEIDLSDNQAVLPGWRGRFVVSSNGYLYTYTLWGASDFNLRSENYFTSVEDDYSAEIPTSVTLHPNYPNPFNPTTTISFDLPEPTHATLEIYDVQGRLIERVLADAYLRQGTHRISWDAGNRASGMYVYRLRAGNEIHSQTMLLIK